MREHVIDPNCKCDWCVLTRTETVAKAIAAVNDVQKSTAFGVFKQLRVPLTSDQASAAIKFDSDKPTMSLLPTLPLLEIAKVLDFGKQKYAAHNWRKGIAQSRLISAAMRHIVAYNDGEDLDAESNLSHLAHAACTILFCLEQQLLPDQYSGFDDRFKRES